MSGPSSQVWHAWDLLVGRDAGGFSGQLLRDEPLARHTYYRIGGPARALAVPRTMADLEWLSRAIQETGVPFFVLGAGSNILVADAGFDGLVIKASRSSLDAEVRPDGLLRTGGGMAISSLLRRARGEGWAGLEFLTGIPGSIGGAVRMNAGTHLGEARERVRRVEAIALRTGRRLEHAGADLRFDYRKNLFLPDDALVLSVDWEIRMEAPAKVRATIDETLARRKATQPIDYPSCGSVFKNPRASGIPAWQVIDKLGLRGHRVGGAQFSDKHPNFIINVDAAKAADVRSLIELAKARAAAELGVALEEEVIYLA